MKPIFIFFSFMLLVLFSCDKEHNAIKREDDLVLGCIIKSDKHIYKMGENPEILISITNLTSKPFYLIYNMDGSSDKRRMPFSYFDIQDSSGYLSESPFSMCCGFMNPLRRDNFQYIGSGDSFDPYRDFFGAITYQHDPLCAACTIKKPGTYKIRYCYSTKSSDLNGFIGSGELTPKLVKLLNQVPKVKVYSNEIEITFIQ